MADGKDVNFVDAFISVYFERLLLFVSFEEKISEISKKKTWITNNGMCTTFKISGARATKLRTNFAKSARGRPYLNFVYFEVRSKTDIG